MSIDGKPEDKRVVLPCGSRWVAVRDIESVLISGHVAPRDLLLLVDRVLEISRERLDLFDLLAQICSKPRQLVDHLILNVPGLVRLSQRLLMIVAQYSVGVVEAAFGKEQRRCIDVVDDVGDLEQGFRTVFERCANLAEVRNEILE